MLLKLTKNINFNLKFMFGYAGIFFITLIFVLMAFGILSLKESDNKRYVYLTYNNNLNDFYNKNIIKICDTDIPIVVFSILVFFISLLSLTSIFYMPSLFNDLNVIKKHNLSSAHPCELSKISNNILYWHIALFQFIMSSWLIPVAYVVFYNGISLGPIMILFMMLLMFLISVIFSSLIMVAVKINCINFTDKCTDKLIEEHRNIYEQNIIFGCVYLFVIVGVYSFLLTNCISYFCNKFVFMQGNFVLEGLYFYIAYIIIILIMSYFTYFTYIKNQHIEYLKYLTSNINEFEKYYNQKFINLRINLVMIFGYITIFYLPLLIKLNSSWFCHFILIALYFCVSLSINKNPISIRDGIIVISLFIAAAIVFNPDISFYLLMFKNYFLFCIILYFVWRVIINKRPMSDNDEKIIIIITFLLFAIMQAFFFVKV